MYVVTKERTTSLNLTLLYLLILGSALLALGMLASPAQAQTYVDAAAGAGSGTGTQADPYGDLQTALANTSSGEIRVAAGTYYPDEGQGQTDDARSSTFILKNGITITGGFDASNWNAAPTPETTPTILSGDLTQDDGASPITEPETQINGDNSIHVVTATNVDATARLEGVIITAGNANGSSNNLMDDGGGLFIRGGDGPTIRYVTITGNRSTDDSGGLNVNDSQPTIINVRLTNNYTQGMGGGVSIDGSSSDVKLINAVIAENTADGEGGGINANNDADVTLINTTVVRNTSNGTGGGISISGGSGTVSISNSIFWENLSNGSSNQVHNDGNLSSSNNLIDGGAAVVTGTGTNSFSGTLDTDPQFADPANNDFRLQGPGSGGGASVAIDAGLNSALDLDGDGTSDVPDDLNRNSRVQDATGTGTPTVDLGAFESDGSPLPVELASFTAQPDGRSIQLAWSTLSETENAGFHIQHQSPKRSGWSELAFVEGAQTTDQTQSYRHTVQGLDYGIHRFRLRQVDLDGTPTLSAPVTAELRLGASVEMQIFPNPVRDQARIRVTVRTSQAVSLALFDVLGREVRSLHDGELNANQTRTLSLDASGLSSGMYFLRMMGERGTETRQVTVVR